MGESIARTVYRRRIRVRVRTTSESRSRSRRQPEDPRTRLFKQRTEQSGMKDRNRRQVLRYVVSVGFLGLPGCVGDDTIPEEESDPESRGETEEENEVENGRETEDEDAEEVVDPWDDVTAYEEAEDPTMVAAGASDEEADEMVEVVYFGDFACPACVSFERNTFPTLRDEYVATGEVRFVFKPVDFIDTSDSTNAALGARAVWDESPEAYWTWHHIVFSNFDRSGGWATPSGLAGYAEEAGVDGGLIQQSVEQQAHADEVERHISEATEANLRGTPSFLVDGTLVTGGDYTELSGQIDAVLSE